MHDDDTADAPRVSPWPATDNGYTRALAAGHLRRHGHVMTAHYVHGPGFPVLTRTCCPEPETGAGK